MCVRKSDFFPNVSTIMTNGDLCLMCTHRIPQKNLDVGLQPLQNLRSGEFRLPRPWDRRPFRTEVEDGVECGCTSKAKFTLPVFFICARVRSRTWVFPGFVP